MKPFMIVLALFFMGIVFLRFYVRIREHQKWRNLMKPLQEENEKRAEN